MQETYNDAWYASNEMRHYPLSSIEAIGSVLPTGILVDAKMFTPSPLYVSGLTCTRHLISVVFTFSDGSLAAALSVAQPIIAGKHYVLDTVEAGVAGAVVFGSGALVEEGSWSFQPIIRLDDGCFINKDSWPVTTVGKQYCKGTSGRIELRAGNDLMITRETVLLGNCREDGDVTDPHCIAKEAFVLRLADNSRDATVYTAYAPKCAMRPVTETCSSKGILSIGGVTPDGNGNINLVVTTEVPGELLETDVIAPTGQQVICPNTRVIQPNVHVIQLIDTREMQEDKAWTRPVDSSICEDCSTCEEEENTEDET